MLQKWAKWFLTWTKENKNKFVQFLFFSFPKNQRKHYLMVQALKTRRKNILGPILGNSQHFLRPCAKLKSNISNGNFGIWVL